MLSGLLISKYLPEKQKRDLALAISQNLHECPQDLLLLAELISDLSLESQVEIHKEALDFILQTIDNRKTEQYKNAITILKLSPILLQETWAAILKKLIANLHNQYNFINEFQKHVNSLRSEFLQSENVRHEVDGDSMKNVVLGVLDFLSQVYTTKDFPQPSESIIADRILFVYLGHADEAIASICSQLIRWRVDFMVEQSLVEDSCAKYFWTLLFDLRSSSMSQKYKSIALVIWLRFLGSKKANFKKSDIFQNAVINQEFYWQILQQNLVGDSHEIRKLCLSVLQLSLKQINISFSTSIMSWDVRNEAQLLREWSRYTTLFEVLGIDTSLHQTQAAVHDIINTISEKSLIHPSWGFCLLSTGFRASMDSVRRYSAEILFSIEPKNLHLLKYGLTFLEHQYLPYLMLLRHFAVRPREFSSNEIHCDYADKYCRFISSLVTSLSTPEEFSEVLYTILSVLASSRESFDAVRIYTCYGLVRGLEGKKVLQYGKHDSLLIKLFDDFTEGELFKKTMQTLNLRLVLNFHADSLSQIGELLSKFKGFNGYEILNENCLLLLSYLSESGFNFDEIMTYVERGTLDEETVIFLKLAFFAAGKSDERWNCLVQSCSDLVTAKLLESGFSTLPQELQIRSNTVFKSALEGNAPETIYESLSSIPIPLHWEFPLCLWHSWEQLSSDVTSDEYATLRLAYSKLKFLNKYIELKGFGEMEISLDSILNFYSEIFTNSSECAKQVGSFYKLKENMFGEFFRLLSLYVDQKGLHPEEFSKILSVLTFENSHYSTLLAIGNILKVSFSRLYADNESMVEAIKLLSVSVAELDEARFKLSEKKLHLLLVEVFFHEAVLKKAVHDQSLNDHILAFAEVIILNAYGRRGLMTSLVRALSIFQISHRAEFEGLKFVPNLLVKAMVHRENQTSAYRIEIIIGDLYDKQISASKSSHIYSDIYGVSEVAYKVWLLAILNSIKTSQFAQSILDTVFDEEDDYHLFNVVKQTDGAEEYTRLQLAKIIISVLDKVDLKASVKKYFHLLIQLAETDPSPLVRVYFEWALAQFLLKDPELSNSIFQRLSSSLKTHELRPTLVTLYERVLFLMIQSMGKTDASRYMTKLIKVVVPAASTNKAITRHFSMSLAISICEEIRNKNLDIDEHLVVVIENMYESALAMDAFGMYRSGDAQLWNIVDDLNLVHISGGLLLRLYDRDIEFIVRDDFVKYLSKPQLKALTHPIGEDKTDLWIRRLKDADKKKLNLKESSESLPSSLQTKSGAWSSVMHVDAKTQISDIKRSELIVVASLVDKAPNLGGICRLCDVLGAGMLTLHDMSVKNNQQFKSVAVTADYWMPMTEVKQDGIVKFLRKKKAQGYTLIGLEQTDNSVVLDNDLKFPAKSLILLGREKEGIPGELLAELDLCVEIKQVGVVRSMNIQTATAVIVHAYSSQNC